MGCLRHGGQPLVGAFGGNPVAVPDGEVKRTLHLLGCAVDHDVKGFWKAQLVQDVEELVGRQGANGANRIGCRKESVGASAETATVEIGAVAAQGHHTALEVYGWFARLAHQRTMTWEP